VQDGRLVLSDLRMGLDPDYTFNFAVAERRDEDWQAIEPEQIQVPLPISGIDGFRRLIGAVWHRTWHEDDTPLRAMILAPQAQATSANEDATPASSASK
jgi:inner membrane protein